MLYLSGASAVWPIILAQISMRQSCRPELVQDVRGWGWPCGMCSREWESILANISLSLTGSCSASAGWCSLQSPPYWYHYGHHSLCITAVLLTPPEIIYQKTWGNRLAVSFRCWWWEVSSADITRWRSRTEISLRPEWQIMEIADTNWTFLLIVRPSQCAPPHSYV